MSVEHGQAKTSLHNSCCVACEEAALSSVVTWHKNKFHDDVTSSLPALCPVLSAAFELALPAASSVPGLMYPARAPWRQADPDGRKLSQPQHEL